MSYDTKTREYMSSDEWRNKRTELIEEASGACDDCGSSENLECHHKTYENLGSETREDIAVLCNECHNRRHRKDNLKKLKGKKSVGGEDISLGMLKSEEKNLEEWEKSDPEGFYQWHKDRRRKVNWKQGNFENKELENEKKRRVQKELSETDDAFSLKNNDLVKGEADETETIELLKKMKEKDKNFKTIGEKLANLCRIPLDRLSEQENDLIESIKNQDFPLTQKQKKIINRIYEKRK